jgi:hypothetical protein
LLLLRLLLRGLEQPHRPVPTRPRRPVPHRPPRVPAPVAPQPRPFIPAERGEEAGADGGARGTAGREGDGPLGAVDGDEEGARVEVQGHPQRLARLEPARRHPIDRLTTAERPIILRGAGMRWRRRGWKGE